MQITIVNRKKYNAGDFSAKVEYDETDFPVDIDEVSEELGLSNEPDDFGIVYNEVAVSDFDLEDTDLDGMEIDTECTTLDDLEGLLETLDSLVDAINRMNRYGDMDTFKAAVEVGDVDFTVDDFIDFDSDRYYLHHNIDDEHDLGEYAWESGWVSDIDNFVDFDQVGRDYGYSFDVREYLEDHFYPDDIDDPEVQDRIRSQWGLRFDDIEDIDIFDIYDCSNYDELGRELYAEGYFERDYLTEYLDYDAIGSYYSDEGWFTSFGWLERCY